jgi:hypothetical protein
MVPNLVTGVWGVGEDRSARFKSILTVKATAALPVYFMKLVMYILKRAAARKTHKDTDNFLSR